MTGKERKRVVSYLLLIIIVSVILSVWGSRLDTAPIVALVQKAGIWAPLIFVILIALTQIFAPVSGTPIFLAGYVMFENKVQLFVYFAFLISSVVNFYVSRKWGRAWVTRLVGKDDMRKVDSFTKDYGIQSLIFLRLFQGHLADFISYGYGLTNMKFTPYMVVNILAPVPWLLLWHFYIFPRVNGLTDFSVWFLITLIPFLIISWFYWKYKGRRK